MWKIVDYRRITAKIGLDFALCISLLLLGAHIVFSPAWAGNSEMVNKSIEELDTLNKEAVSQIEELPARGKVELKAKVSTRGGKRVVKIIDKKIQTPPEEPREIEPAAEVVEGNLEFNRSEKIPQGAKK